MTEAEWLACNDLDRLLRALQGKVSERKRRLFACACCRRIWHLIDDKRCQDAIVVAERFADGAVTVEELALSENQSRTSAEEQLASGGRDDGCWACYALCSARVGLTSAADGAINAAGIAIRAVGRATFSERLQQGQPRLEALAMSERVANVERAWQVQVLHEIVGNPFRPLPPRKGKRHWEEARLAWLRWSGGVVAKITEQTYEEQTFEQLPILADALEEAGCTDDAILSHLRSPGPHVRGCWALDLILSHCS